MPLDQLDFDSDFARVRNKHCGGRDSLRKPFVTQIPLVEVFERLKKVQADEWQKDFCQRLQYATERRQTKGIRALIHAQPQLGKSIILAQTFPAWLFGHDPLHRFALATFNIRRSNRHARVVIRTMQSPEYKDLFPDKNSHLPQIVSPENFFTNARKELNDGQQSFNPMGLQSGFVGTGADTLVIDDPYKSAEEANSETIRENIEMFWDETSNVRLTEFANVFGMFHRYHQADLAGYLLATGEFDYWRYASEADGDYIDDETGLSYPDPLNREIGQFISPRFSGYFYAKQKANPKTWYSQFQGRPTGEEGNFFNVKKIHFLDPFEDFEAIEQLRSECVHWSRAWDNAATKKETSAFTVGARMGITLDERILIDDLIRDRFNTAERYDAQLEAAEMDGFLVPVLIPNDPGSAGTDTAFQTIQMLEKEGYTCIAEPVSGSKPVRAQPLSLAVNSGKVYVALPKDKANELKKEYKHFPRSTYKDITDATGDDYRYLYKLLKSGTVIKNYNEARNIVNYDKFFARFENISHWRFYVGCRISEDASKPSGAAIIAHVAENSGLKDTLVLVGCIKKYTSDYYSIFAWIKNALLPFAPQVAPYTVLKSTEAVAATANTKLDGNVALYERDKTDGIAELNWYFLPRREDHPFNQGEQSTGMLYLVEKENDLLSARQEAVMWKYNDKGEPQEYGGIVLDCIRMVVDRFATHAEPLTVQEEYDRRIPDTVKPKKDKPFTPADQMNYAFARIQAEAEIKEIYGGSVFEKDAGNNWYD